MVVWFTGLPASGKTTLAVRVYGMLKSKGIASEHLDGDALRKANPTGFSRTDRDAHVIAAGRKAAEIESRGVVVLASLISPYRTARRAVREACHEFVEIHLSTPVQVCEARDPKGLYAKARRGEIKNFTGIDDPYEDPEHPELTLDTSTLSVEEAVAIIMDEITTRIERQP